MKGLKKKVQRDERKFKEEIYVFLEGIGECENLTEFLLRMMSEKGLSAPKVYHKAEVDRQVYNKLIQIRKPRKASKQTLLQISIGLHATEEEAVQLLKTCGFAFELSNSLDKAFLFCIRRGLYSMYDVYDAHDVIAKIDKQNEIYK